VDCENTAGVKHLRGHLLDVVLMLRGDAVLGGARPASLFEVSLASGAPHVQGSLPRRSKAPLPVLPSTQLTGCHVQGSLPGGGDAPLSLSTFTSVAAATGALFTIWSFDGKQALGDRNIHDDAASDGVDGVEAESEIIR
jgi:hypothetical protein